MLVRPWCALSVAIAVACSSHPDPAPSSSSKKPDASVGDSGKDAESDSAIDATPGTSVEHGVMVDYETLDPVPGLTVSDNGLSTTTDDGGAWSLVVPQGATLQPTVTSSTYSKLLFPESTAVGADIDFSAAVIPDSDTYNLEETVLSMDTSKALVQVVVMTMPSCASAGGGTLSVTSPSGASVAYFNTAALPSRTLTSFQPVQAPRPVAVVYDIDPSGTLSLQMSHPTCTQVPFPVTYQGREYTGAVPLQPAEPGGVNSALVLFLQ